MKIFKNFCSFQNLKNHLIKTKSNAISNQFLKNISKSIHINDIPNLKDFIHGNNDKEIGENNKNKSNEKNKLNDNLNYMNSYNESRLQTEPQNFFSEVQNESSASSSKNKIFYLETYGCQMNENDSEIINTILKNNNFTRTEIIEEADVILTNTCAIRDSAEEKVWKNIIHIKGIKKRNPNVIYGVLGCMAERMKEKILEKSDNIVDLIIGPDAYRDIPHLVETIWNKEIESEKNYAINVQLSLEETYADIIPVRKSSDNIRAYLSIMRGCNNMCSFCIVPFTRGRERSRPYDSIFKEVEILRDSGIKEITLLGQNVNSFLDETFNQNNEIRGNENLLLKSHKNSEGFKELYKIRNKDGLRFTDLIHKLSYLAPEVRFRFTSPHPKDFPEELIDVIKNSNNICKQIHLPAQSGNTEILHSMRRYYSREAYLNLVNLIRNKIPKIALSSDFISGFCDETDSQFSDTLSLIEKVGYDMAFLFAYSMREKTHAYHNLKDNVPEDIKKKRLNLMIEKFREILKQRNLNEINSYHLILVEGKARRNYLKKDCLAGRTDTNKLCVFPNIKISKKIPEFLKFNLKENDVKFFEKYINNNLEGSLNKDNELINFTQKKETYYLDKFYNFKNKISNLDDENTILKDKQDKFLLKLFYGFNIDSDQYDDVENQNKLVEMNIGDYIIVKINDCSTNTLFGTPICKIENLSQFFEISEGDPYFYIKDYDSNDIYNMNIFEKSKVKFDNSGI